MMRPTMFLLAIAASSVALGQSAPLPRAQFITEMDGQFRKIDADKDGQLTRIEVELFQKASIVAAARARNRQMFATLDTDKDGNVSTAEGRAGGVIK